MPPPELLAAAAAAAAAMAARAEAQASAPAWDDEMEGPLPPDMVEELDAVPQDAREAEVGYGTVYGAAAICIISHEMAWVSGLV